MFAFKRGRTCHPHGVDRVILFNALAPSAAVAKAPVAGNDLEALQKLKIVVGEMTLQLCAGVLPGRLPG